MNEENMMQLGKILSGIGGAGFLIGFAANAHRGMLICSNFLFFVGIFLIIGFERAKKLFLRPSYIKGTGFLIFGLILTIFNHGFVGSAIQLVGAYFVFGGFIPVIMVHLRKLPIIGPIFKANFDSYGHKKDEDVLPTAHT